MAAICLSSPIFLLYTCIINRNNHEIYIRLGSIDLTKLLAKINIPFVRV